jgi:hypothetical protein
MEAQSLENIACGATGVSPVAAVNSSHRKEIEMATTGIAPTTHIAPDNNVVLGDIFIAAPRERVFQAISDPQQAVKWWGQCDKYQFSEFKMDVRVGGKWSCAGSSAAMGGRIEVHGEFLVVDPPRKLAYTWS